MITKTLTILLSEDDPYYQLFTSATLEQSEVLNQAYYLEDIQEMFDYLWRRQKYGDPRISPRPDLILLNLDQVNAEALLEQIETNSKLQTIPIALLAKNPIKKKVESHNLRKYPLLKNPLTLRGLSKILEIINENLKKATWS